MSLPSPNLDDRKFQDLVDQAKRQIALRCPEWTDHNVSDPGVTLIELFAGMTEMMLYRLNQVPEKNHIAFLELLGIELEAPAPARTELRFRIPAHRITDDADGEANEMTLPGKTTIAGTIRTETEDGVDFATDRDLRLVRPRLSYLYAFPASANVEAPDDVRVFSAEGAAFPIFGAVPIQDDSCYFGFEGEILGNLLAIEFVCVNAAAHGLNESYPAQVWEGWNGELAAWERLSLVSDSTFGFNRTGIVEVEVPWSLTKRVVGRSGGYWIRCRYTLDPEDVPPKGPDHRSPDIYHRSPEIRSFDCETVGGTVSASNCVHIAHEVLGRTDGTPGQSFQLRFSPVMKLAPGEHLAVGVFSGDPSDISEWTPWIEVKDFSQSGPGDRHFVCDYLTGQIRLGPNIVGPDGVPRQYGRVPDEGLTVGISGYRYGGGVTGNVREGKVTVLKRALAYVSEVTNPRPALGGSDREEIEHAKMRVSKVLQSRNRAVTAEDFELLALESTSEIGRAKCLPLSSAAAIQQELYPGTVKILLVPSLSGDLLTPRYADLKVPESTIQRVRSYLDERRLLTTVLRVGRPRIVFVSVQLTVVIDPRSDPDIVAAALRKRLHQFLHPTLGGLEGKGWPFGRNLSLADIYMQVGTVKGLAFLLDAKIYSSTVENEETGSPTREEQVSNADGLRLEPDQIVCSRDHRIIVKPMASVGLDEETVGT